MKAAPLAPAGGRRSQGDRAPVVEEVRRALEALVAERRARRRSARAA